MSVTLYLGWWLAPLAVTVAAFVAAKFYTRDNPYSGGYANAGAAAIDLIVFGLALIVSLVAWLVWALLA